MIFDDEIHGFPVEKSMHDDQNTNPKYQKSL